MRWIPAVLTTTVLVLTSVVTARAQSTSVDPSVTVPRLVHIAGVFQPVDGQPPTGVEVVTLSIYADQDGGLPVWQERQSVTVDKTGRFALLLGASYPDGIPADVFGSGQAQWMSLLFERVGEVEQPRVRIASVPYSLKASDAETLGGLPASAYLRAPTAGPTSVSGGESSLAVAATDPTIPADVLPGTTNFLAKYVSGANVGNSAVYETPTARVPSGAVGIGTTAPADVLHLRLTNTGGDLTGLAVQNLGNTATSYSGMLFYDQFGTLGQFQGFNNGTHEYRINNIARNVSSQFNGTINLMIGGTSRFLVASNGNIGIGTTAPSSTLELSNVSAPSTTANLLATTFVDNSFSSLFIGRKARGTSAAPAAVQTNDQLAFFGGRGHGVTGFASAAAGVAVQASQNWTDAAQGTRLQFSTTTNGTAAPAVKMTLDPFGNIGLGTTAPSAAVEVLREGNNADFHATSFGAGFGVGDSVFLTRTARGTAAAPTAVQAGDNLGAFGSTGYGLSGFGAFNAGMAVFAAENWTDTALGTFLTLATTAVGSPDAAAKLVILPDGNTGIGTFGSLPTIPDKLQVFGDIRIGTAGPNGCIRNFEGTGILGTCVSDRRYKKDITPFTSVLNQLTALQPVHYFWRAADFPQQHFGESRAYGLIAQDVEAVLPELVVTGENGFKAVDYTKLPLLTIQAVKELKAENEALKQRITENEALKERVDELERLVTAMLLAAAHR